MTENNERLEGIKKIENTIAKCEVRIDEIETKKIDLLNKVKSKGGDFTADYLKQLMNLKNEKDILLELSESCEIDLQVLDLLRPVEPKTQAEFAHRTNQVDKFLQENEINNGYVESLRTFRNQLITQSKWSDRPEPPQKTKLLPWS